MRPPQVKRQLANKYGAEGWVSEEGTCDISELRPSADPDCESDASADCGLRTGSPRTSSACSHLQKTDRGLQVRTFQSTLHDCMAPHMLAGAQTLGFGFWLRSPSSAGFHTSIFQICSVESKPLSIQGCCARAHTGFPPP